ncbi:hypothetical protein ACQKCU_03625 [Heyndrickxia sporothermodurans]
MINKTIRLDAVNDVKTLVEILSDYDFEVDMIKGRYIMNAKSILGIFSLDLTQPVLLRIHSDACDDLLEKISPFIVGE